MDIRKYSKLIGALVGNVVAIGVAWLAVQFPSVAECAPSPAAVAEDVTEVCTVLGFGQAQITAALMMAFNSAFVYWFPPNKTPA